MVMGTATGRLIPPRAQVEVWLVAALFGDNPSPIPLKPLRPSRSGYSGISGGSDSLIVVAVVW